MKILFTIKFTANTLQTKSHKDMHIFCKPVNHTDDPEPDWYDSTKKNLESIRACVHQVQLADDEESSASWRPKKKSQTEW